MKKLITACMVALSIKGYCQLNAKSLSKITIKGKKVEMTCENFAMTDKASTDYSAILLFQNQKYDAITDIRSITVTGKKYITDLATDIYRCVASISDSYDQLISFERKGYSVFRNYNSTDIWLMDKSKEGYIVLSIKSAMQTADWLKLCKAE